MIWNFLKNIFLGLFGNEHRRQCEAQQEALHQCNVVRQSEQLPILDRCGCEEPNEEPIKVCMNCNGYIE